MATFETVYEVWFKRQNRKEGDSLNIHWDTFASVKEAREACLMLQEEDINIWKIHRISEHLEKLR